MSISRHSDGTPHGPPARTYTPFQMPTCICKYKLLKHLQRLISHSALFLLPPELLLVIYHFVMDSAKSGLNTQGLDRQMCVWKEIGSELEPAGRVNSWWHKCDPKERRRRGAFVEAFEIPVQPEEGLAKLCGCPWAMLIAKESPASWTRSPPHKSLVGSSTEEVWPWHKRKPDFKVQQQLNAQLGHSWTI